MPRIFTNKEEISGNGIVLRGENAHHVARVLRMKPGERLTVCDFFNTVYECTITETSADEVLLKIDETHPETGEFPFGVTLYMALPKGDKMEWIIQKSVELGVTRIVPFSSRHTVVKLDAAGAVKKQARWQKIALAAAGQCGRGVVPEIGIPVSFEEALTDCVRSGAAGFICYEGEERTPLGKATVEAGKERGIGFFVGAEGGFDRLEIEKANAAGIQSVTLGKRILRCETAPLYVLSVIGYLTGNENG